VVRELQSLWQLEDAGQVCSENGKYYRENQTLQSLAKKEKFVI
jgi:hypothetical protein